MALGALPFGEVWNIHPGPTVLEGTIFLFMTGLVRGSSLNSCPKCFVVRGKSRQVGGLGQWNLKSSSYQTA